jgi:regulator of sigma E protease
MLLSIVVAAFVLGLLIIVHEGGHFLVAKWFGVRVVRFSIGYPPKIFGFRRKQTEYAIGAVPLGGYVKMLGEEVSEGAGPKEVESYLREIALDLRSQLGRETGVWGSRGDANELAFAELASRLSATDGETSAGKLTPQQSLLCAEIQRHRSVEEAIRSLAQAPPAVILDGLRRCSFPLQSLFKRTMIVLAGPVANVVFAPLLLTVIFIWGVPLLLPVVGQVDKKTPASEAGLRPGDKVVAIDGQPIGSWEDLSQAIKASNGARLQLVVERRDAAGVHRQLLSVKPARQHEKTVYGAEAAVWIIGVLPRGDETLVRFSPFKAMFRAGEVSAQMTTMLVAGIVRVIDGAMPAREALGGPLMIAQMAGREARKGMLNLAMFIVMLSLELGIINVLPIPMLDGGHLLFFACEGLRGKPLKLQHREMALQLGLLFLAGLVAFVIFNDISHIVRG